MTSEINRMIQAFLEESRHSDGGWAPVEQQDLEQLNNILTALIIAKWDADPDGDRPIEYTLVDRTRCQRNSYIAPHYWHTARSEQERMNLLQEHMTNVQIALGGLDITTKLWQMERTD